jgi:hypothetical protein
MPLLLDEKFPVKPLKIDQAKGVLRVEYVGDGRIIAQDVQLSRLSGDTKFELEGRTYGLSVKR